MILDKLRESDFEKVMITCDLDNVGSARSIEKNGGILETVVKHDKGLGKCYWIDFGNQMNLERLQKPGFFVKIKL